MSLNIAGARFMVAVPDCSSDKGTRLRAEGLAGKLHWVQIYGHSSQLLALRSEATCTPKYNGGYTLRLVTFQFIFHTIDKTISPKH